jgi:hypothetical protein
MSQAMLNKLIALCDKEEQYTPIVANRLRSLGVNDPDPAVLSTIATYYEALGHLASE